MSGGSYDYAFEKLNDFIHALESRREQTLKRQLFADHLKKVSNAMKAIEWVDSSDCGPGHDDEWIDKCLGYSKPDEEIITQAWAYRKILAVVEELSGVKDK